MAFMKGPLASENRAGMVKLATVEEVLEGADTNKAVTPAGVKAVVEQTVSAPTAVTNRSVVRSGNSYALTWNDPANDISRPACVWAGTLIVRKAGSFPTTPTDGDVVVDSTVRDQYAQNAFVDTPAVAGDYKYRAFPYSTGGAYSTAADNLFDRWVIGFRETLAESAPDYRITYLGTNAAFTAAHMDFTNDTFDYGSWLNAQIFGLDYLRPCMLYNEDAGADLNGTVAYYLDPNDHEKKFGTDEASDVSNPDFPGNAMVQVRTIYKKVIVGDGYIDKYFSNVKVDDDYECYNSKQADGSYADYWYGPMFKASLINGKFRSLAGQTLNKSKTAAQERTYAQANGAGWDTETWTDDQFWEDMTKLLIGSTNGQAKVGEGVTSGGESALLATGTTLNKGMMYGSNATNKAVKAFYRENPWGSQWDRLLGILLVEGVWKVKMTKSTVDGSTADDYNFTGDGYITLDVPAPSGTSGGYIKEIQQAGLFGCFPTVMSGSESTYLCDGCWFNNSGTRVPLRGGTADAGRLCGPSSLHAHNVAASAAWTISAALSYHP